MMRIFISTMPISYQNLFDHLLESSHRDGLTSSKKNIGFCEEVTQVELIEVYFTHLIWSSGNEVQSLLCYQ